MQPEVLLMDEPTEYSVIIWEINIVYIVYIRERPIASSKIEDLVHDLKKRLTVITVTYNMTILPSCIWEK
jgi:phosphate transport system ATP-binding protein